MVDSRVFETVATYVFAPPLNARGGRVRRDGKTTDWWLILRCDPEIGRFYRGLYEKASHGISRLSEPLWGTHVSVIRDEKPPDLSAWKAPDGNTLTLQYENDLTFYGDYGVVSVHCPEVLDYRETLWLKRDPEYPLHMTIGNRK